MRVLDKEDFDPVHLENFDHVCLLKRNWSPMMCAT